MATDFGPQVNAAGWFLVAIAVLFLGARIWVKVSGGRALWWDDFLLIAAWLLFTANQSIVSYAISLGFGSTNVLPENITPMAFSLSITALLSAFAVAWSKTSFAVMLLRITTKGAPIYIVWFTIVSMNLAMTFNALLPFVQCIPAKKAWDASVEGGTCWSKDFIVAYGVFAAAYSAVTDFVLAIVSGAILVNLQMRPKEKIGVVICMSLGALAGTTGIIRAVKVPLLRDFGSPGEAAQLLIWTAVEISVTTMVASIPVLRIIIVKFVSQKIYKSFSRARDGFSRMGDDGGVAEITAGKGSAGEHKANESVGDADSIKMGGIMKTNTIQVQYDRMSVVSNLSVSLELQPMDPRQHGPKSTSPIVTERWT